MLLKWSVQSAATAISIVLIAVSPKCSYVTLHQVRCMTVVLSRVAALVCDIVVSFQTVSSVIVRCRYYVFTRLCDFHGDYEQHPSFASPLEFPILPSSSSHPSSFLQACGPHAPDLIMRISSAVITEVTNSTCVTPILTPVRRRHDRGPPLCAELRASRRPERRHICDFPPSIDVLRSFIRRRFVAKRRSAAAARSLAEQSSTRIH